MPDRFTAWIEDYERAWRTAGTEPLAALFTPDARYLPGPFEEPIHGLEAIASFWEAERDGPDEPFTLTHEIVVAGADTAVARCEVHYVQPRSQLYRDLWIITLEADGRCSAFEEWPFWPDQPTVSD